MPFNDEGEWVDDEDEAQRLRDEARGGADPSSGYLSGDPQSGYSWNSYGGSPNDGSPNDGSPNDGSPNGGSPNDPFGPEPPPPPPFDRDTLPPPPVDTAAYEQELRDQARGTADPSGGYFDPTGQFITFTQGPNVGIPYEQQTDDQQGATNAWEIAHAGPSEVLPSFPSDGQDSLNGPRVTRVTPDGKAVQFTNEADAALYDQQVAKYAEDQKAIREWEQGLEMQKFDLSKMIAEAQVAYNNALLAGKDRETALLEAKQAQDAEYRRQDLELRQAIAAQTLTLEREKLDLQRRSLRRGGRMASVRYAR